MVVPLRRGLDKAERVVIAGCSAGAIAVMHHIDRLAALFPAHTTVVGLPDSGYGGG
jgi:poly(3-hydroxybutyrate) depolymerase